MRPLLAGLICLYGAAAYGRETPSNDQISEWRKSAEKGVASAQYSLGQAYDSGNGVPRDAAEAAKWYRKAADQGNAEAQCELAFLYQCGNGLPEDATEAAKWYRKAAELGNITAQIRLGIRYMGGSGIYAAGVPKDEAEGIKWWKKASDQGSSDAAISLGQHFLRHDFDEGVKWLRLGAERNDATAQVFLGDCLLNRKEPFNESKDAVKWVRAAAHKSAGGLARTDGQIFSANHNEAAKWYRKAAENDDGKGQRMLGLCYNYGIGLPIDLAQASKWYREGADRYDVGAMILLADCYARGVGMTQNNAAAVKWWSKAAKQGGSDDEQTLNRFIDAWNSLTKSENPVAENMIGDCYAKGKGVFKDYEEAIKWYRKAAEKGHPEAQRNLGYSYFISHNGIQKNDVEAVKWFLKAAAQGETMAQYLLGICYRDGDGVRKDSTEAVKWWRRAAEQGDKNAQGTLAACYRDGAGVAKDAVESYKWGLLASVQAEEHDKLFVTSLEENLTREQIAEGQKLARNFKPRKVPEIGVNISDGLAAEFIPRLTGTGFFITENGYLITNNHVVEGSTQIRLATSGGLLAAKIVKIDSINDLALLKAEGKFPALPVMTSRAVKLGGSVATVGFPNIGLQGFAPKLAKGEIASLTGAADDARYFQISVPVQPGNSGGALVDERGNVVGVVSAKLNAAATLAATGSLPENVNYAVKSSFLLGFLESVPEIASALKEPNTKEEKFEAVVKAAEQATVLVLVY